MQPLHVPSARRHLLDRPQRLGFLPTTWFWNDAERQRLVLPIVLSVTLPWMPVFFYLVMRWPSAFALFVIANTLAPYLGMGLIERHIRRELRRRALADAEPGELPVQASPAPPPSARSLPVHAGRSLRPSAWTANRPSSRACTGPSLRHGQPPKRVR
ncbi:hypothetical protein OV090_08405 [Nannocystis sp. RBIL2]|uniref:hypothetical protein n=1 Tax=Nannocystis sp. RBIL2 TaxID=2996788 RepID=UPI00226D5417|nr:hypothetical protein [Nannocystis sp. RBIL2]MCY1064780.1 hypothetical protein [Nannocystis sp. RBIL2]